MQPLLVGLLALSACWTDFYTQKYTRDQSAIQEWTAWECAQTSIRSHVISNRKTLCGTLRPCEIPAWPRRKDHFRQETAHFSHQGLLQFLQNEATGEHHLKSKGHKTEIIGDDTSDTLCTANAVSVQMRCSLSIRSLGCNTHETLYLHGEAGGVRNWWGVVHWDPTGEHKLDTEAAQRMGRLKAAFPYNAGGESQRSLNKGQSPAIR